MGPEENENEKMRIKIKAKVSESLIWSLGAAIVAALLNELCASSAAASIYCCVTLAAAITGHSYDLPSFSHLFHSLSFSHNVRITAHYCAARECDLKKKKKLSKK